MLCALRLGHDNSRHFEAVLALNSYRALSVDVRRHWDMPFCTGSQVPLAHLPDRVLGGQGPSFVVALSFLQERDQSAVLFLTNTFAFKSPAFP